jgi:prepilin-type N-terminal cleavage/methylation domain-containing protein
MGAKQKGFTIVELLIVVIVIGILASITVVAYGGLKSKATVNIAASTVKEYVKILEQYAVLNEGKLPQADWACLGEPEHFVAENGYSAEWCHKPYQDPPIATGALHPINTVFNGKLKTIINRMPNTKMPEVQVNSYTIRGMFYDSSAAQNSGLPVIQYFLQPAENCPTGIMYSRTSVYTWCEYRFQIPSETGT